MSVHTGAARMKAIRVTLREARTALGHFLHGFFGIAPVVRDCRDHHGHSDSAPTAASVRDALTAEAARRGRCC